MRTRERRAASAALLLVAGAAFPAGKAEGRYGLGRAIAEADVASWNIDVRPDGAGLPPGRGTVAQGKEVYLAKCSACHATASRMRCIFGSRRVTRRPMAP